MIKQVEALAKLGFGKQMEFLWVDFFFLLFLLLIILDC